MALMKSGRNIGVRALIPTLIYYGVLAVIICVSFVFSFQNYHSFERYRMHAVSILHLPLMLSEMALLPVAMNSNNEYFDIERKKIELISLNSQILNTEKAIKSTTVTFELFQNLKLQQNRLIIIEPKYYSSNGFLSEVIFSKISDISDIKGILSNVPVISEKGLYGRIGAVKSDNINIISIFDAVSRIPVFTKDSKVYGIATGNGFEVMFLYPNYDASLIKDGEEVLTSGENDLIAPEIPFGVIKKVDKNIIIVPFSDSRPKTLGILVLV